MVFIFEIVFAGKYEANEVIINDKKNTTLTEVILISLGIFSK